MCRALRVLCGAVEEGRLAKLKRAALSAHWEVVGGAASVEELVDQVAHWSPDVVIIDAPLGGKAVRAVRKSRPKVRIVTVGQVSAGEDRVARSLGDIKGAVLGLPATGGPVTR
jgi:DNA-binding NarL/FixJ family response regulator